MTLPASVNFSAEELDNRSSPAFQAVSDVLVPQVSDVSNVQKYGMYVVFTSSRSVHLKSLPYTLYTEMLYLTNKRPQNWQ